MIISDIDQSKKKQKDEIFKEKEDEIKKMEEYGKVIDKQDLERYNYYKNIENKQIKYQDLMLHNAIKEQNDRVKQIDEKTKQYQLEKNKKFI